MNYLGSINTSLGGIAKAKSPIMRLSPKPRLVLGGIPRKKNLVKRTQTFITSDVFVVPVGVYKINVKAIGGGGGGGGGGSAGGGANTFSSGGGGGGSGGSIEGKYNVAPKSSLSISIGTGGSGGAYGIAPVEGVGIYHWATVGNNGNPSTITQLGVSASGGNGGGGGLGGTGVYYCDSVGTGGVGGTGTTNGNNGSNGATGTAGGAGGNGANALISTYGKGGNGGNGGQGIWVNGITGFNGLSGMVEITWEEYVL